MEVVLALEADGPVIRLRDKLDDPVSLIGVVERALTVPSERLVIDLRKVTDIDEHGVSALLAARRLCQRAAVELQVAESDAQHARLERYGLASRFTIARLD
jgi:anti-anti-sigma regulatory factor